jgi:hypothetical protein
VDISNLVPHRLNSSTQNLLVKTRSRSYVLVTGILYNFTTLLRKRSSTDVVYGCLSGMKLLYLVYLSTTTNMIVYPLNFGNPPTKSRHTSSQALFGTFRGLNRPG